MCETSDIILGDCLDLLRNVEDGSVDLIYLDPPFNTGGPRTGAGGRYDDAWPSMEAYLAFLTPRVREMHRTLAPTGSILLHCDWRASHHLRLMLDDIFGSEQFVNHLIWSYGLGGSSPRRFARKHDDILFYGKTESYYFNPPMVPATSARMRGLNKKATDVLAIPSINNMATERVGWPTQKPLALLTMLIEACCPNGGFVLDPFCGSGTTLVAAAQTGRRSMGFDINPDAVATTQQRLANAAMPPAHHQLDASGT